MAEHLTVMGEHEIRSSERQVGGGGRGRARGQAEGELESISDGQGSCRRCIRARDEGSAWDEYFYPC